MAHLVHGTRSESCEFISVKTRVIQRNLCILYAFSVQTIPSLLEAGNWKLEAQEAKGYACSQRRAAVASEVRESSQCSPWSVISFFQKGARVFK